MKLKHYLLIIGGVLGFMIWIFSVAVTGEVEPWDARGAEAYYYWGALLIGGFISGLIGGRNWYYGIIGLYLGQIVYIALQIFKTGDPGFVLVGLIGLIIYLIPAIIAALIGWGLRFLINKGLSKF